MTSGLGLGYPLTNVDIHWLYGLDAVAMGRNFELWPATVGCLCPFPLPGESMK
ncbi:hypothetical protein BDV25DRAFT_164125 [Aspergillus avenaceus]|uniref:Uncharacterized protein n=1 Tax=Aspergillus avenaceus TaxID=36643 RepID=A0A5N6TH72_ASPAV|nr:hypothetical protein BDV25DRAFT_164125 [Aspergillus avenaceus]